MKRILGVLGGVMLTSLLLSVVLVVTVASLAGSIDPAMIRIHGDTMSVAALDPGDWLVAIGGIGLALLIVVLVVPLAVMVPLAIAAVALVGALLLVAGVLAMVFSPLIFAGLVVWLIVRLIRRDSSKARAIGSATITG